MECISMSLAVLLAANKLLKHSVSRAMRNSNSPVVQYFYVGWLYCTKPVSVLEELKQTGKVCLHFADPEERVGRRYIDRLAGGGPRVYMKFWYEGEVREGHGAEGVETLESINLASIDSAELWEDRYGGVPKMRARLK